MAAAPQKPLLRFVTCGSVDDGKSTLLGRLLADTGSASAEELAAADGDFSRLLDSLEAEREQGITVDVAYRFFSTPRRAFIVADAPGHEQYTRNFVTGASTSDAAVVLVDAARGVTTQTRRHSFLARLLGIRSIVLAVNKMDLVGYDRAAFERISEAFGADVAAIPVAARSGDNIASPSPAMPWYRGPTLLDFLETVETATDTAAAAALRMPVQWVGRGEDGRRAFAGRIASGTVGPGEEVRIMPRGTPATVTAIAVGDNVVERGTAGQSVSLALAEEVDCGRGDVIAAASALPEVAEHFEATLVWLGDDAMVAGRQYVLKLGTQSALATLHPPKHEIDVDSAGERPSTGLATNAIGTVSFWTDRPLVFAPYEENRDLGGFILIDRIRNDTVAAGMIRFALRRTHNLQPQQIEVRPEERAALKGQAARLLWFTGLSGAGKSTIANLVERRLHALGRHTFLLDGDNLRLGLNRDLGFTEADRAENIRRAGETARLMVDAGLIVLAAFISPYRAERRMVREMLREGEFVEIHVDVPLAEAERRDPKGLYGKARRGELPNFTGIGAPYEAPERPEIRIDTATMSADDAAERIVRYCLGES